MRCWISGHDANLIILQNSIKMFLCLIIASHTGAIVKMKHCLPVSGIGCRFDSGMDHDLNFSEAMVNRIKNTEM